MPFTRDEKIVARPMAEHWALFDRVEKYKRGSKADPVQDVTPEKNIYSIVMERLGYPNSIYLRRILEHMFISLELEVMHSLLHLPLDNQVENLAKMFDMPVEQIADILEGGFQKGVLFPRDRKTRYGYRFIPRGMQQIHDGMNSNPALDLKYGPKIYHLYNDWCYHEEGLYDYLGQKRRHEKGIPQGRRVLPAFEAILAGPDADKIQPWEDGRVVINSHFRWALAYCSCRRRVSGGGMTCKRTSSHVCLNFDIAAETVILRNGREISREEALEVLKQAHRDGLVGSMEHYQTTDFFLLCFCCDDCCHHWAPHIRQWGEYDPGWRGKKSRWEVSIDEGMCNACEDDVKGPFCIRICEFNALEMKEIQKGYSGFIGVPGHEKT
ncbi:MAG: hypothetical protein NTV30_06815, partial [Chloroflexi bacterium]|nr:hypothetical protein [Chloroflexota bacterium]